MDLNTAIEASMRSVQHLKIDEYAARCLLDTLDACGYAVITAPKNQCPCGISPQSWMFCSAGSCDVCVQTRAYLDALAHVNKPAAKHTDNHVPCPTCGFHVVTHENNSIYIDEDN